MAPGDDLPRKVDPALLKAVARAKAWFEELASGRLRSLTDIARREKIAPRYVERLSRLSFVAPRIVEAICQGRQAADLNAETLLNRIDLPLEWSAQLKALGDRPESRRIEIAQSTVARYMARRPGPPSQGWKTFLRNHAAGIASVDLFVVRTISFKLLHGLVILRHARRKLVRIGRDEQSYCPVDRGSGDRCLSLGRSAVSPDSRPRRRIRSGVYPPHSSNADPRSPYRSTLAVAERAR